MDQAPSFLIGWSERTLPEYMIDYGGERAGVPKGDEIPFPPHKVRAAIALLAYGAPGHETLTAIAKSVGVTSALLRVWRTEARFLALYRHAMWQCADDFVRLLAASWQEKWPSPSEEFQKHFGIPLQQAILRRLYVDILHMVPTWVPFSLSPRWLSEYTLVGSPPRPSPHFDHDEVRLMRFNSFLLLSSGLARLGPKEPGLAQWATNILIQNWAVKAIVDSDLRDAVKRGDAKAALGLIDFVTGDSPIDDMQHLHRLVTPR